jgi:hypothetical protein
LTFSLFLPPPASLDHVVAICGRHFNRLTEDAYCFWIRHYILFHHKQHPCVLGALGIAPNKLRRNVEDWKLCACK